MNIDKDLVLSIFIIFILIAASIEFPIFGFALVVCIFIEFYFF